MGSNDLNWVKRIYEKHVDDLFSYGRSMGFQEESCKDAIQETFYQLHASRERLHHVQNITAYLFRAFKNNLLDQKKKNERDEALDLHAHSFEVHVTVLDDIIDDETRALLKKRVTSLLDQLTPNQREAVYLKYMTGLQHKEIADILHINEASVRKLVYRAMEKLRKQR